VRLGVDLFSGCGGFSLGAAMAGVSVVAAVEVNTHACATYKKNLIDTGRVPGTLFDVDILTLTPASMLERVGLRAGQVDIVVGGPPCQGFSTHRLNDSGVGDPRNAMLLRYFEFIRALRPAAFLIENVPGLLWPRHATWLSKFRRLAEKSEYTLLEPAVLNAKDYGVPQNRKRVFLFGHDGSFPKNFDWVAPQTHGAPGSDAVLTSELKPWVSAAVAFTCQPKGDPDNRHMNHNPELTRAFKATPKNGGLRFLSGRVLPCHEKHDGHFDVYGRIDPTKPAPTMTTACINPSKGRFVHPTRAHGITARQAARLQSFPDWYAFQGGLMAAGSQIGNAVPPLMAKIVIEHITAHLASSRRARAV
jgi:DNA (cytosine-5)-methyltransferase 1